MFDIILCQPEIPPNTGNIIRLCANAGARLHLIHPMGFALTEKSCRRAGLDYHSLTFVREYGDWDEFASHFDLDQIYAITKFAKTGLTEPRYHKGHGFLFGSETSGLPEHVRKAIAPERHLRIPMVANNRSLNLANAVSITLYEAWRQCDFEGAVPYQPE